MKLPAPRPGYFQRRQNQKKKLAELDVKVKEGKGEKGGRCNRTACQMPAAECPDGVRWFNHSTRRYYCWRCAWSLNEDPFNKRDAQKLWGHNLCTLEAA